MTDLDRRLSALFAPDMPSLRDPAFETEVLAALMRRRLFSDLGLALAASLIGAIALGVLWPVLAPTLASLGRHLAPAAIALTAAVSIAWMASGRSLGLSS